MRQFDNGKMEDFLIYRLTANWPLATSDFRLLTSDSLLTPYALCLTTGNFFLRSAPSAKRFAN
jgi:hypothetical protein